MSARFSKIAFAAAALSLTTPMTASVARADATANAAASSDASVKAARAKFQEGVRAYDKGQYEKARAAFLQTYALHKHPAVLLNLAQSCLKAGHTLEADTYFQQFTREATMSPDEQRAAESGLAEARRKLGRIDVHAPAGVSIAVDGAAAGSAPLGEPIDVEPGSHVVHAGSDDQTVSPAAGETVVAQFAAPAVATAASASKKSDLFAPPKNMVPVYVTGGIAVVGIVTGIVLLAEKGGATSQAHSAADLIQSHGGGSTTCAQTDAASVAKFGQACSALATDNSQIKTDGTIADVALIIGVGSLIGGAAYYLMAEKKDDGAPTTSAPAAATARFTPSIGRGFEGFSLSGTF